MNSVKGTILAISGFLASICTAQGNNGGTSQPHDWDNLSEPITYVVHSKSYDLAPDGSTVLDDTTIDYLGPGQTGTTSIPWAHNFSNEDKSSFQEVHEQFRIKYHWVAQNKPAPDFVYVTVNATAFAKGEPATGTVVLDNALGSPTVFMGEHDGYQARGTLTFKVPVSNGYAEKTLNLSASAYGLKSPTTGLLTNYATASTTVTTEIKGVKIVSDRSQTFKKEHDSTLGIDFKVANDETSTTDARIDVLLQMAGMQQNYVTFHGVFASVLEGSWINPYHVWIDFYGRTFSDSLLDEFDTLGSRYTAPFSQDVLKDGLTGSMHLSVRNLDPNDDVTIDFPLTTHFHMPQENPTVGRVDQDQIHRDKEILHAGPAAMMGGSQIVKISETLTI